MATDKNGNIDLGKTLSDLGSNIMGCSCLFMVFVVLCVVLYLIIGASHTGH